MTLERRRLVGSRGDYVVIGRHGETVKNVLDRHGGPGSQLTPAGRSQMVDLAKAIHLIRGRRAARVWTEPTAHAADSARIVGQGLGVSVSLEPRLRGIDLGVLAGLSREEAARRYPAAAASLEAWRRGEITSKELMVPGKEPVTSFEQRVRSALASMLGGPQQATVFIGTRSTLIMVTNLLELGCGFCYDAYVPYVVPNGAHCAWEWGHGTNRWVRLTDGPWK